jgi:hypothetical protein
VDNPLFNPTCESFKAKVASIIARWHSDPCHADETTAQGIGLTMRLEGLDPLGYPELFDAAVHRAIQLQAQGVI